MSSDVYGKTAKETKAAKEAKASEASPDRKAAEGGKQYAYQRPQESATGAMTTTTTTVEQQKQRVVSAFDDFMDALAEHVSRTTPAAGGAAAGTGGTPGATPPGVTGAAGQPAAPGAAAPSSGTGVQPAPTAQTPAPTTQPSAPSGGEAPEAATEAEREANEVASARSAYVIERARETERRKREQGTSQVRAVTEAGGGVFIRTETNKHTSDSNRSPLTESEQWESSYGSNGKGAAPTIERMSVANKRPETVPGAATMSGPKPIDAWYGSFGTAIEKAMARAKMDQKKLEKIIGTDDRVRVTNNEVYPWRCICSLRITANTGTVYVGTGWLVSPRLVLTAGHCVFMSDEGGWATQIEVIPGRDADERPFGSAVSRELRSVTGWTQDNDSEFDYGAIILPTDKRFGDQLGWFGYASRADDYLSNLTLNLAGYPGDGGPTGVDGSQWWHSRMVRDVFDRQITYEIDTFGGQSGAPVWEFASNGGRYGVAIHTYGDTLNNGGTRITGDVFDTIVSWAGQAP